MEEIEELINDPGNHALLKETAKKEQVDLETLAQKAGLTEERTKDKAKSLEKKELLQLDQTEAPIILKLNRENLKRMNDRIKQFQEDKRHILQNNLQTDKELLQDAKEELNQKKEETNVVKKQKRFENQLESVDHALEMIKSAETDNEFLEAHSHAHRLLKLTDNRQGDFHGFNPFRKLKASKKIEEVLENEPEKDDDPRRFFGNRWVKKSRLQQ